MLVIALAVLYIQVPAWAVVLAFAAVIPLGVFVAYVGLLNRWWVS
jgi:hypothetical protein